ncbi:MAG: two pore domain potassium channel family protein [Deltaproteobacteria bacterium]|nr:two pore domain potassium channel family protein [Deltaproteobacteria bacterium]MBI3390178.1 two pore domain potassium channel family protein [Deltaproteobacteria bacterium]
MRLTEAIGRDLLARRHTALLLAIVGMFAVRPFLGDTGAATIAYSVATLLVGLVAILTIQVDDLVGERERLLLQRRRRRLVGWALAASAVTERVWAFFAPSPELVVVGSVSWLLFFSYVTWSLLRSLLKQREVTGETITLSVSIYLLLGICWGLLYVVIFARHPEAFQFPTPTPSDIGEAYRFPILLYFSFTTLSTIGYGDITPLTLQARYAAVAEGITGQFYLAILVARLVGMQMSRAATPPTNPPAHDRRTEDPDR